MGQYSAYDIWITPMLRDWTIFVPIVLMWIFVQWFIRHALRWTFGDRFKNLPKEKQDDLTVRAVAICNGLLMIGSAVCFISDFRANNYTFHNSQYKEIEGYRFYRVGIVAYFAWDIIVCIVYRWGLMWKIHGIASFLGAYMLSFPFSDHYGSYFSGMFELSNTPLHLATILRAMNVKPLLPVAAVSEVLFALMFLGIRVVGGTLVSGSWLVQMTGNLIENFRTGGNLVHGEVPVILSMLILLVVQSLQYVWFVEIVKTALQMFHVIPPTKMAVKIS